MSERLLKRLVAVLVILGGLYGATRLFSYVTRPQAADGGALGAALARINRDTLLGGTIVAPDGARTELRRGGGRWTANGFPADSAAVAAATNAVSNARVVDLVAQSAQSHAQLGVATDSTWTVELQGSGTSLRLLIGRDGRDYNNTYARAPDDDNVYEVSGSLRFSLAKSLADWRDKVLTRVDTAAVRGLIVSHDRVDYRAVRDSGMWRVPGTTGAVNQMQFADILSELRRFDATGIAADTVTFDGAERRRVVALNAAGDTLAVLELAGTGGVWRVRTRGDSTIYEASAYRVERLAPKREDVVRRE